MVMNETLKDIPWAEFTDKEGKFKVTAFKLHLKQQSILLRESIKNNDLIFRDYTKEQKDAISRFIEWYYD